MAKTYRRLPANAYLKLLNLDSSQCGAVDVSVSYSRRHIYYVMSVIYHELLDLCHGYVYSCTR